MKRIEGAGWLVLVLALMGVTLGPLRAATERPSAVQSTPSPGDAVAEDEPAEVTTTSVEVKGLPLPAAPELARSLQEAVQERFGGEAPGDTLAEVLTTIPHDITRSAALVSLPDPRLGRQARYFDQGIDALRRGAIAHGYDQLAFVLPTSAPGPEPDQHFILFGDRETLLVALLVLESPVEGPRSGDLLRGLSIAHAFQPRGETLRVLGPFFSGSASSLGTQLERFQSFWRDPLAFDVVSGTATKAGIAEHIERHPDASFRRTTPNDEEMLAFLLTELGARHGDARQQLFGRLEIALLTEFDTAFGNAIAQGRPAAHTLAEEEQLANSTNEGGPRIAAFRYPSAISEVRLVRQRQEKQQAAAQGDDPLSLRRTLQLELDSTLASQDIPPLSSQITPFERELELGEQLTRICRERYDYLILTATDPLDLIFLAEETRKYCPGLPLVALGAEKIFRHPDVREALDGLLVVGSYPLLGETPPWSASSERPFSSHVTHGLYNAWLTLLNEGSAHEPKGLLDYLPLEDTSDPAVACDSENARPLWLTALSAGTFWPLRTGCVESPETVDAPDLPAHARATEAPLVARVSGTIRVIGLLLLAVALGHVYWLGRVSLRDLGRDLLGARYRFGASLTLFLLLALVMPAMIQAPVDPRAAPWLRWTYGLAIGGGYMLLTLLACDWVADARRLFCALGPLQGAWQTERRASSLSTLTLLTFGMLFVCLAAWWIVDQATLPYLRRQVALTRIYNPLGMSPLAPPAYLAMAYYAWSIIGLARVQALTRFSEAAPLPLRGGAERAKAAGPASGSTLTPALEDVLSNLRGAWSGRYYRHEVLAALFAAVPGAYFCLRVRPTWESLSYDWLLKLGLAVLYGLVVVASVHFLTLVTLLRRFLRQLAALPMVDSYDRVAVKMKSSFGIQFGVRVPALEELQLSGYSATLLEGLMAAERATGAEANSSTTPLTVVTGASDSNRPVVDAIAPNQGGPPLPAAYQEVFQRMLPTFAPRSRDVTEALRAFRHGEGRSVDIEEEGHRALHLASQTLFVTLRRLWALRARLPMTEKLNTIDPKDLLLGGQLAELPTVTLYAGAVPPRVLLWMRVAEDFVTLRIATFLSHVMTHLRYLLAFTLTASLLLILAVSSYPLEPTRFVTVFSWTLMLAVIVLAFVVIVRMERNEVLSRLSGSTPGRIDFNFALGGQLVVYVGLPLLAVLANIFPEIRDQLFAWAGPIRKLLP